MSTDTKPTTADRGKDEDWFEFLEANEAEIRREANSDAPDAHHFQTYLEQLEEYQS